MTTEALARFDAVLRFSSARGVSDIHVKAGQRPVYRRHGGLISRKDETPFTEEELDAIAATLLPPSQAEAYARGGEATFAHGLVGGGRFRMTLLRQRGSAGFAIRVLPARVATLRELNLPKHLGAWPMLQSGLLLVAGIAGSGRTATWAALLEHVNTTAPGPRHIVTLASPLEIPLDDKVAFVCQREVGADTPDLHTGLQATLRQDADIVAVDELKPDALADALDVADQGRLVIAVVPGAGPVEAVRMLLERADPLRRDLLRQRLAARLRAITAQVLVTTADGKGRVPAVQALVASPQVTEILRSGADLDNWRLLMEQGRAFGMQTQDQALQELVQAGLVSIETATQHAQHPEQVRARLASHPGTVQTPPDLF
jgi:twitching motility protein PilT